MTEIKISDAHYLLKCDGISKDTLLIGVISKSFEASCWARIDNEYLSTATIESLLNDINSLELSLIEHVDQVGKLKVIK